MAETSKIEWLRGEDGREGATWNVVTGCSIKSPGCRECYAMRLAGGRLRNHPSRRGLTTTTKTGPVWNGVVRFNEQWLDQPLAWTRPRSIFVAAHGDLFHEGVPDGWIDSAFAVMALAPRHTFMVLTKRPERMLEYLSGGSALYYRVLDATRPLRDKRPDLGSVGIDGFDDGVWHRNIWLGTSVENQAYADERHPYLAQLANRDWNTWVSYEPALGPVRWDGWEFVRWMVSGGESGRGGQDVRPSHPDWHRATRDFCLPRGIAYHFKQQGSWGWDLPPMWRERQPDLLYMHPSGMTADDSESIREEGMWTHMWNVGKRQAGAMLDGREHRDGPPG